jgi:heavy metal sensor kinase
VNLNSLRFKLIWIHSAAIALVIFCIGLVRYQLISYRLQGSFDADLLRDARLFASRIHIGESGFSWSLDDLNSGQILEIQESEPCFVLTDAQGQVLHENFHSKFVMAMLRNGDLKDVIRQSNGYGNWISPDDASYRFVSFPLPAGIMPQPAVMHIGRSMELLKGVLREYLIFYVYSVPLILAISVAVGWYLARRALKPFEEITRTAEKITYENLNAQLLTEHKEEEIQRLVHSFNGMVRRLNESFQQMRKFNADAAHELRTPLAILQGETEVALRSPNLPDEIRLVLASNLEELDRLKRIVNDMLTIAEAEAGRQVLLKDPVDMKPLLEDLVDQMRLLGMDRNVQIELECNREIWIDADKLWIRRAIINLLDNAIKYSKDGGVIRVTATSQHFWMYLEIRDFGIGISPEDLPHIFDRLYRADPARSRDSGGAGLGLALVKWIVEAHKGNISVESQADSGSCFRITLPTRFL